ncbi:MAG TPA: aminotransferase class I/II-fold pyridoxal phosphate-dependent enzyme [Thermoplasmata archaeon]|nr:aminotransferase class I/II-fold pyridoxal phosphate-dependent enzyme [Thermoplasmata archaeon]
MRFPLADWIDTHRECRYDLASSGMRGSIPPPRWPARRPPPGIGEELVPELARYLGVPPARVFVSHGASEANAWVLGFLARELPREGRARVARVRYPEYPPLFDTARAFGFEIQEGKAESGVAVVSRPRNPEGDLWSSDVLAGFADGARHLVVDETFREFARVPSLAQEGRPRLWTTGSFTKFFGADEIRVGFAVAPPDSCDRFGRYVGLVSDEVAPASAAVALSLLRDLETVRSAVRGVLDRNLRALTARLPGARPPVAPLYFDRLHRGSGRRLAERCLGASVLVCPGSYFGDPRGVRLCLTRKDFPRALGAYLDVRDRPGTARSAGTAGV